MTRTSFCTQGAMPRDKYDVIRRGTYWFLFANCLGLVALLVVSTLAYGLVGLIDSTFQAASAWLLQVHSTFGLFGGLSP